MESYFNLVIILQHSLTSVIGIIGNFLVIIVYKNKLSDNQTITFFILQLAITDLACCLFVIPINCYHELNLGEITSDFMCKIHTFLVIINITYSCLLMTLVAFERCFSIVFPFRKVVTKPRAKVVMAFLFFICFLIGLAGCLGVGIYHKVFKMPAANVTSIDANSSLDGNKSYLELSYKNNIQSSFDGLIAENKEEIRREENKMSQLNRINSLNNVSLSLIWMRTNHCFPNDYFIPIENFHYIQLIQNAVIVICFTTIFILYALICVLVSKRRQLKVNRANYYKEILFRSKQHGMINMEPIISSNSAPTREKSDMYDVTSLKETRGKSFNQLTSVDQDDCKSIDDEEAKKKLLTTTSKFKEQSSRDLTQNGDEQSSLKCNDNMNKATQTKTTAIAQLKINREKEITPTSARNILKSKNMEAKAEVNLSSSLLANLKTAFMLFVVTLIMIIVYTPALLTSLGYIKYNSIHWNLIYINNAINPLVYSFLNTNFRDNLKRTFKKSLNRLFS